MLITLAHLVFLDLVVCPNGHSTVVAAAPSRIGRAGKSAPERQSIREASKRSLYSRRWP
jgi:hypothetical protein